MTWRGLIFDLDGTLADTLRTISAALNHGLEALGLPSHPGEAVAGMVGEGVEVLCRKGLPEGRLDLLPALTMEVRAFYDRNPMLHVRFYDGVAAMIEELRAIGARLAVLSNKPHPLTVQTIAGLGASDAFEVVLGQRDEFPRKPDPTSTRWILGRLELAAEEVLYVGDTPIDMQTARAAGMTSVAVTWGFRGRDELARHEPGHFVDRPDEIVALYRRGRGGATPR